MTSINESAEQLSACQDQTFQGDFIDESTGETGKWAMVTDGHGSDICINFIRSIPLNHFMGKPNPVEALAEHINLNADIPHFECSGSTICLVKVYSDRVVCINAGDSQAAVYKNGELVFMTEEHNPSNKKERERLETIPGFRYLSSNNIKVVSPTQLRGITTEYACWPDGLKLAITQALGHNSRTGLAPDVTTIYYDQTDALQVVIGSDGLWDMVNKDDPEELNAFATMTSDQVVTFATNRWKQMWDMAPEDTPDTWTKSRFTRSCDFDDVCAVKIDIAPSK